jgi:hypothetical protein
MCETRKNYLIPYNWARTVEIVVPHWIQYEFKFNSSQEEKKDLFVAGYNHCLTYLEEIIEKNNAILKA